MRFFITLSALSCILLFSCQKESDFSNTTTNTNGNGGTNGTRLVKMVAKDGTDSVVSIYSYNSSGKLIGITATGTDGGSPTYNSKTIVRNSQGIIQKVVMKDADLIQVGIDSIEIKARYDASNSRYTGWTLAVDFGSGIQKDSIVFIYNSAGKVGTESFYSDNGTGTYHPYGKFDFTYSGNNIVTKKSFTYDQGSYTEDFTMTDELDTKSPPIVFGIEGLIIDPNEIAPYYSSNNITKETVTYPSDPTETLSIAYTYNSSNKPASAIFTILPYNQLFDITYYYQ